MTQRGNISKHPLVDPNLLVGPVGPSSPEQSRMTWRGRLSTSMILAKRVVEIRWTFMNPFVDFLKRNSRTPFSRGNPNMETLAFRSPADPASFRLRSRVFAGQLSDRIGPVRDRNLLGDRGRSSFATNPNFLETLTAHCMPR